MYYSHMGIDVGKGVKLRAMHTKVVSAFVLG